MKRKALLVLFLIVICYTAYSQERFSAAGFYSTNSSERNILDFNSGWRFYRALKQTLFHRASMTRHGKLLTFLIL